MNRTSKIGLAVARTQFIDRLKDMGRRPETVRVYNGLLRRLIRDLGDLRVEEITNRTITDWVYGLRREHRTDQNGRSTNDGIGPSTFNQTVSSLRVFFKWCQGEGYIEHNPAANLALIRVPKKVRQQPGPDILLQMIEAADFPRDRAYIATAVNTGLRQSEILAIRVSEVDLESGYLAVTIRKTGDVDRQPITLDLDRELRIWLTTYQTEIGRPFNAEDHLFPATTAPLIEHRQGGLLQFGPRVLVPERPALRMEKVVQAALRTLGLPTYGEGTHTIRRAVARAYFDTVSNDQGDVAALRETAALLHHSNLHTTERYLGMTPEKNRRNQRLAGKPFLTAMVSADNVIQITTSK